MGKINIYATLFMMTYYTRFTFFLFGFLALFTSCSKKHHDEATIAVHKEAKRYAVVITPVCDVVSGTPSSSRNGETRFQELPCSFAQASSARWWLRVHQLLFNQVVIVKKVVGEEACIEIPNVNLKPTVNGSKERLTGWVLKKNIAFLNELPKDVLETIPNPFQIPFEHRKKEFLSLVAPIYISSLDLSFSAATNFVLKKRVDDGFICTLLNPDSIETMDIHFPLNACIKSKNSSIEEKIEAYIALIRKWSKIDGGCIPYVLGGASFVTPYTKQFRKIRLKKGSVFYHVYDRKSPTYLQSGMDCSTLIYLAANTVGLNYDLKNTTAIKNCLKVLTRHDSIEVGDIIHFPGHVMIISEIRPLKIIQARGYSSGVGRVIENEAKEFIRSVRTIDDLAHLYFKSKPLVYKNSTTYKEWKIYKFSSYVKR